MNSKLDIFKVCSINSSTFFITIYFPKAPPRNPFMLHPLILLDNGLLTFQPFLKYFELQLFQDGLRGFPIGIMQLGARGNLGTSTEENQAVGEAEMMPATGPGILWGLLISLPFLKGVAYVMTRLVYKSCLFSPAFSFSQSHISHATSDLSQWKNIQPAIKPSVSSRCLLKDGINCAPGYLFLSAAVALYAERRSQSGRTSTLYAKCKLFLSKPQTVSVLTTMSTDFCSNPWVAF